MIIAQKILKLNVAFIIFLMLLKSLFPMYSAQIFETAVIIPPQMRQMNKLYIGITKPNKAIPSGPSSLDSIIENMKPNIPVVRFAEVSIKEFLKKLSLPINKYKTPQNGVAHSFNIIVYNIYSEVS